MKVIKKENTSATETSNTSKISPSSWSMKLKIRKASFEKAINETTERGRSKDNVREVEPAAYGRDNPVILPASVLHSRG